MVSQNQISTEGPLQVTDSIRAFRYKNGKTDGKVWGPWPGSSLSYLELMETPRWEDWDMTYCNKNRFHFLGNGRTERELTGGDLAYYVQEPGVNM